MDSAESKPLRWNDGPDESTAMLDFGTGRGDQPRLMLFVVVRGERWMIFDAWQDSGKTHDAMWDPDTVLASGPCGSRIEGKVAALNAIEETVRAALPRIERWKAEVR